MKIAVSGKGGVGKSTIASILALMLAEQGEKVLALDADPDANLASALGIDEREREKISSIGQQVDLIEERTGAKVGSYGQMFNLSPEVSDLAARFAYRHRGVSLVVLGAARKGGGGCACPENSFIRAFIDDLVLHKDETLLMDMEAGIEHLGRATARSVDVMLVVVEPGKRSIDCAREIERMCGEIGLDNLLFIGNKILGPDDESFLREQLQPTEPIAFLPYSDDIRRADRDGLCPYDCIGQEEKMLHAHILDQIRDSMDRR